MNYSHVVSTALFYANGELHIGHLLEAIQADIYVRHLRQSGRKPLFISGSDAHGTPIMLASKKGNLKPEDMVAEYWQKHKATFEKFGISFDNFHITNSEENKVLTANIFQKLKSKGKIYCQEIEQAFDTKENMFLPDRFVKGTCPKCKAPDQYGDSCESCGAFYEPLSMIDPKSTISDSQPISKKSEHLFFDLPSCQKDVVDFCCKADLQDAVINKLHEWLNSDLRSWDISRDAPYYGFEIPGFHNKYFYVWLDAPIGYIAACTNLNKELIEIWQHDSKTEIVHFIGKDIIYFHGIFWPAVLKAAGLKQPDKIAAHGFLTLNNQKMSKSRGTMIGADKLLERFDADQIRYYLASKINNSVDDIDLNFSDLIQKVNSDLIGKYLNIASRTAGFINKNFNGIITLEHNESELYQKVKSHTKLALAYLDSLEYSKYCKEIMFIADLTNQAIAELEPWKLIKQADMHEQCHKFCSEVLAIFRDLTIMLKPIIPGIAQKVELFLNMTDLKNSDLHQILLQHKIEKFSRIMDRLVEDIDEVNS